RAAARGRRPGIRERADVRPGGLGARRGALAGGVELLVVQRLPGTPRERAVPAGAEREARVRPHVERVGPGRCAHARRAERDVSAEGRQCARAAGAAALRRHGRDKRMSAGAGRHRRAPAPAAIFLTGHHPFERDRSDHAGARSRDVTEFLTSLNPEQREAVEHFEGPILVLAGAGSGKTRVLTTRIAWLIQENGVDPSSILAVTFTNKAAGEMRARIRRLLGREPAGMWMGTFHSLGARLLRRHAPLLGWASNFSIHDADQALRETKRAMDRLNIS